MINLTEALQTIADANPQELIQHLIENNKFATIEINGKDLYINLRILKRGN